MQFLQKVRYKKSDQKGGGVPKSGFCSPVAPSSVGLEIPDRLFECYIYDFWARTHPYGHHFQSVSSSPGGLGSALGSTVRAQANLY